MSLGTSPADLLTAASNRSARSTGAISGVVRVGVIGYGYWGPNIVRNLSGLDRCHVAAICDGNEKALARAGRPTPACTSRRTATKSSGRRTSTRWPS